MKTVWHFNDLRRATGARLLGTLVVVIKRNTVTPDVSIIGGKCIWLPSLTRGGMPRQAPLALSAFSCRIFAPA